MDGLAERLRIDGNDMKAFALQERHHAIARPVRRGLAPTMRDRLHPRVDAANVIVAVAIVHSSSFPSWLALSEKRIDAFLGVPSEHVEGHHFAGIGIGLLKAKLGLLIERLFADRHGERRFCGDLGGK